MKMIIHIHLLNIKLDELEKEKDKLKSIFNKNHEYF